LLISKRLRVSPPPTPNPTPTRESQEPREAAKEAAAPEVGGFALRDRLKMGSRSIANVVFIVLLAAALLFGVTATFEMIQAAGGGPG